MVMTLKSLSHKLITLLVLIQLPGGFLKLKVRLQGL